MIVSADHALLDSVNAEWRAHLAGTPAPDKDWDWAAKMASEKLYSTQDVEPVALCMGNEVQGVLITSLPDELPSPSRFSAGESLIYVEYIATAPWNRMPLGRQRYKRVGLYLMLHAVLRSLAAGRDGRLGLHSVPDPLTVKWYKDTIRLESRDLDPGQEFYEYFEGDVRWAQSFLERS
ncbi:hypothetical protein BE11_12535 [Sorangium cellulosum]|nr:hypothetical protein BE11_12535 [Sorangium cellulosum]